MNCKNQYLKIVLSIAGLSAVPIAIFTLTSCDGSNVKSLVEAQPTPAGLYREYLSETRGQKELSFEDLEPSKQLQTMKNTWRQTFVYQLLLDFNTSNLLFGGSQKSAYLCNAFLPRRILRAFILPSRGQS